MSNENMEKPVVLSDDALEDVNGGVGLSFFENLQKIIDNLGEGFEVLKGISWKDIQEMNRDDSKYAYAQKLVKHLHDNGWYHG